MAHRQVEYFTKVTHLDCINAKIHKEPWERSMCLNTNSNIEITEINKESLIDILTEELPVLRARLALSQDDLCNIIGISRQTYSAIETKKRKMTWNTFLSLILVFGFNEKTSVMLETCGAFPDELKNLLSTNNRKKDMEDC